MSRKTELVVDAFFLIALALVAIGLIIVAVSGKSTEAAYEPTTLATVEETTEYITEPTQEETIATEATEPITVLYDVPLDYELQLHIISEAVEHNIDPAIIIAMAYKESRYKADAIGDNGNSYGLMQIQPKWHSKRMQKLGCTDLLDPYQNVTVAVDYLCELLNRYGSIDKALVGYNQGSYKGTITKYAKSVMAKAEELGVI